MSEISNDNQIVKRDLSPSVQLQKINPYRITDLLDRTIYEFWRVGGKSMSALRDRQTPRDVAYISIVKGSGKFQLGYHPNDGNDQILKDLPLSDLPQAIADLKQAGF